MGWTDRPTQGITTFSRKQWQMQSLSAWNVQQERGPSSHEATESTTCPQIMQIAALMIRKKNKGVISPYCLFTSVVRLWKVQRTFRNSYCAPWPDFKTCSLCRKESDCGSWVLQHITNWKGDCLHAYKVSLLFPTSLLHTSFIILVCFEPCTLQK